MTRSLAASILSFAIVTVGSAADEGDAIKGRLTKARASLDEDMEKARTSMLGMIQARFDVAQKAGDLAAVKRIQAEREEFMNRGEFPKGMNASEYQAAVQKARSRMEAALTQARKEYTQAGLLQEAEAVDAELSKFKAAVQPKSVPTVRLPEKKSGDAAPPPAPMMTLTAKHLVDKTFIYNHQLLNGRLNGPSIRLLANGQLEGAGDEKTWRLDSGVLYFMYGNGTVRSRFDKVYSGPAGLFLLGQRSGDNKYHSMLEMPREK